MIQGSKYIEIADFTYSPKIKHKDDYDNLPCTLNRSKLKDRNIVYTHTFYAKQLFQLLITIPKEFIVITHNSDVNVDSSFKVPANVIKWYSQNVNVENPKIESIPIGIENDRWMKNIDKKKIMAAKLREKKDCKNLVYMNFNINTNPSKRELPYNLLKSKTFVTSQMGRNGSDFCSYIDNIYNHKYVICPEGNGMDTHRFWETLYMGSVPIVVKNINNWFYNDMPVLYVNKWEDITGDLLIDMWNMYKDGGDKEKLTFNYWKNKIYENIYCSTVL